MKKFLFLGALAAMLLGTASCSNEMEPNMADGTVKIRVELPGNIDSRAIADGLTANQLTVAVYDETGAELSQLRVNKEIPHETTVEFQLVKGQTYSFAFWAQAEGAPYTFDTANKTVSVSYTGAKSNDEKRDAFYAYRADLTVTGPMTETIYLYRPFAQLNYGASDYAAAIAAGVNVTKSAVTVNHAATAFNLATGATTGDVEVTFAQDVLPDATTVDGVMTPAKLTVEDAQYDWMAMNYFLVPNNEATIETSLQLYEDGATDPVRDITVPNVPVQKNHRTNIVGNLFTEDVNFNVIIDERFDQPDYVVDITATYYDVTEDGALEDVMALINTDKPEKAVVRIAAGKTVTWTTGASHGSTPLVPAENDKTKEVVFEGGEGSVFKALGAGVGPIRAANGTTTLVFKNLTIVDESVSYAESAWEFGYLEFSGKLIFNNCLINDAISLEGTTNNNSTDLDAELVNCKFVSNTATTDWLPTPASHYIVWISGGRTSFTNCEFTGYRGIKIHEDYGSDVDAVYIDGCNFHDLSKKPGLAIGTVNAPTIISIKNSQFINCQPGDQGLYKYETDTPVANFNFTDENNVVQND